MSLTAFPELTIEQMTALSKNMQEYARKVICLFSQKPKDYEEMLLGFAEQLNLSGDAYYQLFLTELKVAEWPYELTSRKFSQFYEGIVFP